MFQLKFLALLAETRILAYSFQGNASLSLRKSEVPPITSNKNKSVWIFLAKTIFVKNRIDVGDMNMIFTY